VRGSDMGGGVGGVLYDLTPSGNTTTPNYYHYDGRGDVVGQTDSSGYLGYQAAYTADGAHSAAQGFANGLIRLGMAPASFGAQESGGGYDTGNNLQANTKREELANGIDYVNDGQRYRDLFSGRFLTRDPAGYIDGTNEFNYVRDNPWTKWDPEGLYWTTNSDNHLDWDDTQADGSTKATDYGKLGDGGYLTKDQLTAVQGKLKSMLEKVGPENSLKISWNSDLKKTLGLLYGSSANGINGNNWGPDARTLTEVTQAARQISQTAHHGDDVEMDRGDIAAVIQYSTDLYNSPTSQFTRAHPGLTAAATEWANGAATIAVMGGSLAGSSNAAPKTGEPAVASPGNVGRQGFSPEGQGAMKETDEISDIVIRGQARVGVIIQELVRQGYAPEQAMQMAKPLMGGGSMGVPYPPIAPSATPPPINVPK